LITAVDTNVLLDFLKADRTHGTRSREAIRDCLASGSLIASPVVWAEVSTFFEDDPARAGVALDGIGVAFVPDSAESAFVAARSWQRHRQAGGGERRVAADFLIGAHALVHADRLLTRDRGFYRTYFEKLPIVDPSAPR
jgi:predicted nucleic acid-binding protein